MAITNLYLRAMEIQKNNKSIIKYNFQIIVEVRENEI